MLSLNKIFKKIFFDNSCSICKKEIDREGYLCKKCLKKLKEEAYLKNIKNYFYLFFYDDKIREVISDFKLRNRKELGKDIAYIIKKPLFELLENEKIDIIIPVPISLKREKERGFNQVEYLLEILDIKYQKIKRIKDTKHMYGIKNYDEREKNVNNVFESSLNLKNKKILLVDDIVTSGATTRNIEKELLRNNENIEIKIFSVAIARKFLG
ncbi:MAG: ComF family protein [Fusobacterium sp.]|nr:ComF family protein [Fusobacterium sp.]